MMPSGVLLNKPVPTGYLTPMCIIAQMENCEEDPIIAYALNGCPIHRNTNLNDTSIVKGKLDIC